MRDKRWTLSMLMPAFGCAAIFAPSAAAKPKPQIRSATLASSSHRSRRCTTFRTEGTEYGVYIADGHVRCNVAKGILKAIDSGKGKIVNNGDSANSYVLDGGWLCPFGNMGEQTCEHSKRPVNNPSQDIASLSCSFGAGCPKQAAFSNE